MTAPPLSFTDSALADELLLRVGVLLGLLEAHQRLTPQQVDGLAGPVREAAARLRERQAAGGAAIFTSAGGEVSISQETAQ